MGIALIETEATGLKCVCSTAVQDEAVVTDRVRRLALGNVNLWSDEILKAAKVRDGREKYSNVVAAAGFDIRKTVQELQEFYLSIA